MKKQFTSDEIKKFDPCEKLALVASVNGEGKPHVSLLSSLMATAPDKMALGEFTRGLSKQFWHSNPKAGWLIITMDMKMWRGKASWTHLSTEGAEYVMFNEKPMFRYNTYFGINTVHYFDLVESTDGGGLPLLEIAKSLVFSACAKPFAYKSKKHVLNYFSHQLINKTGALNFISFVGKDGFPVIIPALQAKASDRGTVYFPNTLYKKELAALVPGMDIAFFSMNMQMESVLIRGVFKDLSSILDLKSGRRNLILCTIHLLQVRDRFIRCQNLRQSLHFKF